MDPQQSRGEQKIGFVIIKNTNYGHVVVARGELFIDGERTFEQMSKQLLSAGKPNTYEIFSKIEYQQKFEHE